MEVLAHLFHASLDLIRESIHLPHSPLELLQEPPIHFLLHADCDSEFLQILPSSARNDSLSPPPHLLIMKTNVRALECSEVT